MTDEYDENRNTPFEILEDALDQRGLAFGEEGTGEIGELLYQRLLATPPDASFNDFDFELLSMFTILRITNDIGEKYSDEYDRILEHHDAPPPEEVGLTLEEFAENWARIEVTDEIVLFFSVAHEKIEQLTKHIIELEIIHEDYRGSNGTEDLVKSLTQPQREQLLLRTCTVDSGLHSKIHDTRIIRNSLMHNLMERYFGETDRNLLREIERAIEAINELYSMTEEFEVLGAIEVEFG